MSASGFATAHGSACSIGIGIGAVSLAIRVALGDAALGFPFVIFLPPVVLTTLTPAGFGHPSRWLAISEMHLFEER